MTCQELIQNIVSRSKVLVLPSKHTAIHEIVHGIQIHVMVVRMRIDNAREIVAAWEVTIIDAFVAFDLRRLWAFGLFVRFFRNWRDLQGALLPVCKNTSEQVHIYYDD